MSRYTTDPARTSALTTMPMIARPPVSVSIGIAPGFRGLDLVPRCGRLRNNRSGVGQQAAHMPAWAATAESSAARSSG